MNRLERRFPPSTLRKGRMGGTRNRANQVPSPMGRWHDCACMHALTHTRVHKQSHTCRHVHAHLHVGPFQGHCPSGAEDGQLSR